MSYRKERLFALASGNINVGSVSDLRKLYHSILKQGMHGLCFSPYEEGQKPGDSLSEAQVRRRLEIIKPYTQWVRSFSCTEGNELVAKIAKELGMKTMVGAWLGKNVKTNEEELNGLIELANKGFVDIAAVGNEVLYRNDLTETELLGAIYRAKNEIKDVPVGYVDAYYEFRDRPAITEACDIILANCYPFWEGCSQEYSLMYMQNMYYIASAAASGKKVIITETGWPNKGSKLQGAVPSDEAAMKYFINTQRWAKADDIEVFYFSSFDESWKIDSEGDVGAYWGIWDKDEQLKYPETSTKKVIV